MAAARKARDLAQRTFEIMQKEQKLGAGSTFQTMTAQRDLSIAELDMVTAMTIYEKAKVELDRATGSTLEHNGIKVQDADKRHHRQSEPIESVSLANAKSNQDRGSRRFRGVGSGSTEPSPDSGCG